MEVIAHEILMTTPTFEVSISSVIIWGWSEWIGALGLSELVVLWIGLCSFAATR